MLTTFFFFKISSDIDTEKCEEINKFETQHKVKTIVKINIINKSKSSKTGNLWINPEFYEILW
jgi:ribosomal protein L19E